MAPWGRDLTPDQALERLKEGNAEFLARHPTVLASDQERRAEIAHAQAPAAVVVGCSDSRVSPELLFSAGLGELFTVRNAGNAIDSLAMGSVEYGVLVLRAPLIVILGHQRCGAVEATIEALREGTDFPGSISAVIEAIVPSVRTVEASGVTEEAALVDAVIRANVRRTVERLRTSEPSLSSALLAGTVRIVGAEYSLDEGRVDFFLE